MSPGMKEPEAGSDRLLVFAPIGRDGSASVAILRRAGVDAELCSSLGELVGELEKGAAAAFVAEEGLFGADVSGLLAWAAAQPAWSDLPFLVLTSRQEQPSVTDWRRRLVSALRNVSLLERPIQPITLVSAAQT